jgi:hypothetical protein
MIERAWVEKGVPIPPVVNKPQIVGSVLAPNAWKLFQHLEVGDCMYFRGYERKTALTRMVLWAKNNRLDWKFTSRQVGGTDCRVWRVK